MSSFAWACASQDAARLSEVRFKAGTTDYLEVLNQRDEFLFR
jgi:outer membrane protein TolC